MNRRLLLGGIVALPILSYVPALVGRTAQSRKTHALGPQEFTVLDKSKAEWRELLEPARYRVLFEEATEPPRSSPLDDEKRAGTFVCAACYLPLFSSEHKYDSGTGWPSFTRPVEAASIGTKRDFKLVWPRTEYHCARCGGHQGHVFKDGPAPRGERWCNNGLALEFIPADQALPELRS